MAFLELRETLISEDKTGSNPKPRDQNLDLESGNSHEFNKHAPGLWLSSKHPEHCCIYRVPHSIRRVNPEAYTPQLIILGPLHNSLKSQALQSCGDITNTKSMEYVNMEQHKKFYLEEFTQRFEGEETINRIREIIEEDEEMIRASYSESTAWIESPQFLDMTLRDSIFIIEFFLRTHDGSLVKPGDPLIDEPCIENTIKDDLILLENQLPYFLLEKLFDPIVSTIFPTKTFRKLVIKYLVRQGKIKNSSKFIHFTDLFRFVHVETLPGVPLRVYNNSIEHMYNADKLYSGGVKFEAVDEMFSLNVTFENGCLKMPCLKVGDKIEMRLRNVMALEQCHYPFNAHVCNYVIFLDYLIDTHKGVELLVEKGIIKNWIGQNVLVAEMVSKLGLGILFFGSHYSNIADEVNGYYSNPINRSRALLKRVYFGNLWTGTATVAATFLMIMTLVQTVASIIQTIKT